MKKTGEKGGKIPDAEREGKERVISEIGGGARRVRVKGKKKKVTWLGRRCHLSSLSALHTTTNGTVMRRHNNSLLQGSKLDGKQQRSE